MNKYIFTEREVHGGVQRRYKFPNGYGASVVRHSFSYGGDQGLWELAVLDSNDKICYDTPIGDDVIGFLTILEVEAFLEQIAALPPKSEK